MAKKQFDISATMKKNTPPTASELPKKVELKKTNKDLDLVEKTVENMHTIAPKAAKAKPTKRKVDNSEVKRLTVTMAKEIHRKLKITAINEDSTLNDYIVNLIRKDLGI